MSEPFLPPHNSQRHETVHVISREALEHSMRLCGYKQPARTSCWLLNCQHSHKDIVNGFGSIQIFLPPLFLFYLCYQKYTYTDICLKAWMNMLLWAQVQNQGYMWGFRLPYSESEVWEFIILAFGICFDLAAGIRSHHISLIWLREILAAYNGRSVGEFPHITQVY